MPAATHGKSMTVEYRAWKAMKNRCFNPNFNQWKDYGGRGITICAEWRDNFPAFLASVGKRPSNKYMLDREDNDKGYEPGNVRWIPKRLSNHNRRNSKIIQGDVAADVARKIGMRPHTLRLRLRRGWTEKDALNHPVRRGYHPRPSIALAKRIKNDG